MIAGTSLAFMTAMLLFLLAPAEAFAQAMQPISRISSTIVTLAKAFQNGATAMGVIGLIVVAIKAFKGDKPMEAGASWFAAMFIIGCAGHMVEFFTGTNGFTGISDHVQTPGIYQQMKANRNRPQTAAQRNPENLPSIWGIDDNVWGSKPGTGNIWGPPRIPIGPVTTDAPELTGPVAMPSGIPAGNPGVGQGSIPGVNAGGPAAPAEAGNRNNPGGSGGPAQQPEPEEQQPPIQSAQNARQGDSGEGQGSIAGVNAGGPEPRDSQADAPPVQAGHPGNN